MKNIKKTLASILAAAILALPIKANAADKKTFEYVASQFEYSPVVALGDSNHYSGKKMENFLINLIPYLKKAGVTHYAFEMAPEDIKEINGILTFQSQPGSSVIVPRDKKLDIPNKMKQNGIIPVPIDYRGDSTTEYTKTKDGAFIVNYDNHRDKHMAKNVAKILEEQPNAKILAFLGAGHVAEKNIKDYPLPKNGKYILQHPPFAFQLKKEYGIDPRTICILETEDKNFKSPYGLEKDGFKEAQHPVPVLNQHKFGELYDGYVNLSSK